MTAPPAFSPTGSSQQCTTTFQVYPLEFYEKLRVHHASENVKKIYLIRHAEGTHNLPDASYSCTSQLDARLTERGIQQCRSVAQRYERLLQTDKDVAVITSPLTRCVQTALYCFPTLAEDESDEIPFLALESLRETVNYQANKRRPISQIASDFSRVDFSYCQQDKDELWNHYQERLGNDNQWTMPRESAELYRVAERGRKALNELFSFPEYSTMVVCSHSAFFRCILNWGQDGGVPWLPPQTLDETFDPTNHISLLDFSACPGDLEQSIRKTFENTELKSFCLVRP